MDQQAQSEHVSTALATYRSYCQQDSSERRLGTFINILESIFPPISSSHCADDLLLITLLMSDPHTSGHTHADVHADTKDPFVASAHKHVPEMKQGLPLQVSSFQSTLHSSPAIATHAASGMRSTSVAEQQIFKHNNPFTMTDDSNLVYDSSCTYSGATRPHVPAPQLLPPQPIVPSPAPPTRINQVSTDPHLHPRPRPRPIPNFTPSTAYFDASTDANPDIKPSTSVKKAKQLTESFPDTCASTQDFKVQLLDMRRTQLEIDARNVDTKYKLISEEQARMEEERRHRIKLAEQRAEREAAEQEERMNRDWQASFFDQCMQVVSNPNYLDSDVVQMAKQHVRNNIKRGISQQYLKPFVAHRSPSCLPASLSRGAASGLPSFTVKTSDRPDQVAAASSLDDRTHTPVVPPPVTSIDQSELPTSYFQAGSDIGQLGRLPLRRTPATPLPSVVRPSAMLPSLDLPNVAPPASPSCMNVLAPSASSTALPTTSTVISVTTPLHDDLEIAAAPPPSSATPLRHRQSTTPATDYSVDHRVSLDSGLSQVDSPPLLRNAGSTGYMRAAQQGHLTHSSFATPEPIYPPHGRYSARGHPSHLGHPGDLGHSGHSISQLHANLHSDTVLSEPQVNNQMALGSGEISPAGAEFIHVGHDAWYTEMGTGA